MKIIHLLTLALSLYIAWGQESSSSSDAGASWNSSESDNCVTCWEKFTNDAIYCRSTSGKGYCCNGINSASFCTETATNWCSVDLNYLNNKYAYCRQPKESICGSQQSFNYSTSEQQIALDRLTTNSLNGSVCHFELVPVVGDVYSDSARITISVNTISEASIYISQGDSLKSAERIENSPVKEGRTYSLSLSDYTFINVVPSTNTPVGTVDITFKLSAGSITSSSSNTTDGDGDNGSGGNNTITDLFTGDSSSMAIIIAVIIGAVVIIAIVVIVIVCVKVYRKKKQGRVYGNRDDESHQTEDNGKDTARWMKDNMDSAKKAPSYNTGENPAKGSAFTVKSNPSLYGMDYGYE